MSVNEEQMRKIQVAIETDLKAQGYSKEEIWTIGLIVVGLCKAFDEGNVPVLHPLFIAGLRSFTNAIDLMSQLDQERK